MHNIHLSEGTLYIDNKKISIKDYKLCKIINNGANAVILKAQGQVANENVAIKVWISGEKKDMELQSKNEIVKMSKINQLEYSRNLVKYYASGCVNGYYYCVMEYLDSEDYITLREKLRTNKDLSLNERYQILMGIVSGLRYAQENGIFHGDLHLDNVLIDKSTNLIKIIDFGTSFRDRKYSQKRDNEMTLKLCVDILGNYYNNNLLVFFDNRRLENLPQNTIRLIVKAISKVTVLLDFWKYGRVETIVEDIALFVTIVPFFNLKEITELLFHDEECDDKFRELFKEKITTELYEKTKDIKFENLEDMYAYRQRQFVEWCMQNQRENGIYKDYESARIFNGPLYFQNYFIDEAVSERIEIEKVIE